MSQQVLLRNTYLKFSISGGMIPNWLWRSQDPIGSQIRQIDMSLPSRHSARAARLKSVRRMGGARPMGARPMGRYLKPIQFISSNVIKH